MLYNRLVASREEGNAEGTEVSEAGEDTPMIRSAAGERENMGGKADGVDRVDGTDRVEGVEGVEGIDGAGRRSSAQGVNARTGQP